MRLKLRTQKFALSLTTCGFLVGAALVIAWGMQPLEAYRADRKGHPRGTASGLAATSLETPLGQDAFAKLVDIPMRRPLYDPPPPPPVVKQLPPLQVELLGTIIEPENSMAMIRSAQGSVEYKRIGDQVGPTDGPASIIEIHGDSVVLERGDERVTLSAGGPGIR